jgi:hypothetical protein
MQSSEHCVQESGAWNFHLVSSFSNGGAVLSFPFHYAEGQLFTLPHTHFIEIYNRRISVSDKASMEQVEMLATKLGRIVRDVCQFKPEHKGQRIFSEQRSTS